MTTVRQIEQICKNAFLSFVLKIKLILQMVYQQNTVVFTLGSLLPFVMCIESAQAETLKQAMGAAYLNNPALEAERARQRAVDEEIPQALSGWRPTVNLDAGIGQDKSRTSPPARHLDTNPSSIGVSVSQPLFRGLRTLNSTRRARARVHAGQGTLLDTEQQTLLSAATSYMDVIRDRKIVQLRQQNVNFLNRELTAIKAKVKGGELTKTDIDQARTRLHQGQASLAQARADLAGSEAAYASVIGHEPVKLFTPPSMKHLLPPSLTSAIQVANDENPLVISARYQRDAAIHDLDVIRGELLPTVSLDASYQREYEASTLIDRQDDGTVELRFSMPLYNAGTTYSRIRQARATLQQREHDVRQSMRRVKASVIASWQQRRAAKFRITAARNSVAAARAAVKGVKLEAEVGERSVFEILDAQRDLVDAQIELANARRDYVVSEYTVLSSLGSMTADRLQLRVEQYDIYENLDTVRYQAIGGVPGGLFSRKRHAGPDGLTKTPLQGSTSGFTTTVSRTVPSGSTLSAKPSSIDGFYTTVTPAPVIQDNYNFAVRQPTRRWSRIKYRY